LGKCVSMFVIGQRWICDSELELGLGTILNCDQRTVTLSYPAVEQTRTYSQQSAPLRRAEFSIGDTIESLDGWSLTIQSVIKSQGLITYEGKTKFGETQTLDERQLSNNLQLNRPTDRFFTGQIDDNKWFQLRLESISYQHMLQNSDLTGLYDGRTSLIPHQLYIAHEVAKRFAPRVLLADEVGLGKTIEACLIMQHQLITERANRVLIIVPEPLLHQWLVELMRRFNLAFSLFDDERCSAIIESSDFSNPFEAEQLILCSLNFLTSNNSLSQHAANADWDLVIVDEAHHLGWNEQEPSIEYQTIESISHASKGLLLLTATPEQLGKASHFARLRLLDPQRFFRYKDFLHEESEYQEIASVIDTILEGQALNSNQLDLLQSWPSIKNDENLITLLNEYNTTENDSTLSKNLIINSLLDRHGTGRVLFRNTRQTIKGFPNRHVNFYPFDLPSEYENSYELSTHLEINTPQLSILPERLYIIVSKLKSELEKLQTKIDWWHFDSRVKFINQFLSENKKQKILVICANGQTAKELEQVLRKGFNKRVTAFYEEMSIIERDRAASYFADLEKGAQALICSEIGSEGRNFQFSNNIILFDLPLKPDLLEQRIGRLDRIGQQKDIEIHVPYFKNSPQDILQAWYHQGLNAFEKTCQIGEAVFNKIEPSLMELIQEKEHQQSNLDLLIKTTTEIAQQYNEALQNGRDKLLELNSYRSDVAENLAAEIKKIDNDNSLMNYMSKVFDAFGVDFDEYRSNSYIMKPSSHSQATLFHDLKEDGTPITFDRETALANEDMQFITWNHPYTSEALEYILSVENGNTSMVSLKTKGLPEGTIIIETIYLPECIFPEAKTSGINFQQGILHSAILSNGKNLPEKQVKSLRNAKFENIEKETAIAILKSQKEIVRKLLSQAEGQAKNYLEDLIQNNTNDVSKKISNELERLNALRKVNKNIRADEIQALEELESICKKRINASRIRLDAVRIIVTH